MGVILEERGFTGALQICTECLKFWCEKGAIHCCCQRMLFNQPDFVEVESLLETACKTRRFKVLFIPKFHCELNFIEQCWGYSKRHHHDCPVSSLISDLECNVLESLEAISIKAMRR